MSELRNARVNTAAIADANGAERPGEVLTVRDLLEEMIDKSRVWESRQFPIAVLNERFLEGQQLYEVRDGKLEDVAEGRGWPSGVPIVIRNLLRNLGLTWAARVTKDDPSAKAWAHEASGNDAASADVANDLIEYFRNLHRERQMMARAAWLAEAHSCVASYVTWDPARGPRAPRFVDGSGGDLLGDVHEELITILEYGTDGSEDIDDAQWCFIRRYIDKWAARARLVAVGVDDMPEAETYQSVWGADEVGVPVFEIWHKPSGRIPNGLFALVIGGHVVESMDFPYAHGELPLSVWKIGSKSKCPYGSTHVSDAVPLQSALNKLHGILSLITSRSARWMKVLAPKSIAELWDGDMQVLESADPNELDHVRIITPPPPPPLLLSQIEEHERMIGLVFGVNEAVVGSDASATKNARHLAYISELDAQKLSEARRNLEAWRLRAVRQKLRLVQQYVEAERVVNVVSPDGMAKAVRFVGANLEGVDVILEPAPAQTRASQAVEAERAAAAGFEDPMRARELRQTGLGETGYEALARRVVRMQAEQAMLGQPVQADPSVPPAIALEELTMALEQAGDAPALMQLIAAYQQMAAQAGQPATGQLEEVNPAQQGIPT